MFAEYLLFSNIISFHCKVTTKRRCYATASSDVIDRKKRKYDSYEYDTMNQNESFLASRTFLKILFTINDGRKKRQ